MVQRCASAIFGASWMLLTMTASGAYASCGDWLQHGVKPTTAGHATSSPVARDAITRQSPESPCNGPYCTRVPEQPAAPAPGDISFAPMKSVLQSGGVTLVECACQTGGTCRTNAKSAKGFPASIYHPPRA